MTAQAAVSAGVTRYSSGGSLSNFSGSVGDLASGLPASRGLDFRASSVNSALLLRLPTSFQLPSYDPSSWISLSGWHNRHGLSSVRPPTPMVPFFCRWRARGCLLDSQSLSTGSRHLLCQRLDRSADVVLDSSSLARPHQDRIALRDPVASSVGGAARFLNSLDAWRLAPSARLRPVVFLVTADRPVHRGSLCSGRHRPVWSLLPEPVFKTSGRGSYLMPDGAFGLMEKAVLTSSSNCALAVLPVP